MPSMRMASSSLMCTQPIRRMRFSLAIPTMKNAEDFAMLWDTYEDAAPHSIVHELTFFVQEEDGSFSRHDEVHEERTYEVLTYDILLEQAGFKSFKLYADFEDKEPTETSARWFFVAQK